MFDYALLCEKYDEILWWFMDWDINKMIELYVSKYTLSSTEKFSNFVKFMNWYHHATEHDLQYQNYYFHKLIVQDIYKDYEFFEDFYMYLDDLYKKEQQRLADEEFLKTMFEL